VSGVKRLWLPLLNPLHVPLVAEVIVVLGLAAPPPLAGGLAGLATGRLPAVVLPIHVPVIRDKELSATTALASGRSATHAPKEGSNTPPFQPNPPRTKKSQNRRRKKTFQPEFSKKTQAHEAGISDRPSPPAFIPPSTASPGANSLVRLLFVVVLFLPLAILLRRRTGG